MSAYLDRGCAEMELVSTHQAPISVAAILALSWVREGHVKVWN
jgi:hypothetical protein